jgi:hypothetical protein
MCTLEFVTDGKLLRQMERAGHIRLHAHTNKRVSTPFGQTVRAKYIDSAVKPNWEFNGIKYTTQYVDGSFFPYVVTLESVYKRMEKAQHALLLNSFEKVKSERDEFRNALELAKVTIERLAIHHGPFSSADGTLSVIRECLNK